MKRKCYIIAGPNGAGKTTFAREFLPVEAGCLNFVNADLIASKIPTVEFAIERVKLRVSQGGHNIPEQDIRRRFERSWINFQEIYKSLADSWIVFDTSANQPVIKDESEN